MNPFARGTLIAFIGLLMLGWFVFYVLPEFQAPKEKTAAQSLEGLSATPVHEFIAQDLRGRTFKSSEIKGATIVHFWASWCAPCLEEFPSLIQFAKANVSRVSVLAISVDENPEDIIHFVNAMGGVPENLKVLRDIGSQIAQKFGTVKLPESYIVRGDRVIVRKIPRSINWLDGDLQKFIDSLRTTP